MMGLLSSSSGSATDLLHNLFLSFPIRNNRNNSNVLEDHFRLVHFKKQNTQLPTAQGCCKV